MKKRWFALVLACVIVLALCGCAASSTPQTETDRGSSSIGVTDSNGFAKEEFADDTLEEESGANGGNSTATVPTDAARKLIKTARLSLETETFDTLLASLTKQVATLGGYFEMQEIVGKSDSRYGTRRATLTVRVPADKADALVTAVGKLGTVTSQTEQQEDVTLTYVDVESRITALKAERTALLALLEKAASTADIIAIQSQLTDVQYQLESYESRLRTLDNLIAYATVTLSVTEVARETPQPDGVWATIGTNLTENVYALGDFFVSVFVWVASNLPYLLLVAVGCVVLAILWRVIRKRLRARRAARKPNTPDNK